MAEGALDFDDDNLRAIAEVFFQEGNKEYRNKELKNAIYFYSEGIKVNCKDEELNAKLHSNRATANFNLGNYHETLNDAKAAIKLEPTFIEAIERGARACVKLGLYKETMAWCDEGLAINKDSKALLDLKTESEEKMKSKSDSQAVKSQNVGSPHLFLILGDTNDHTGDPKSQIDYHELHLKLFKEMGDKVRESQAYHALGHAHFAKGDFRKAIDCHKNQLKLCKEVGNRAGESHACVDLGVAHLCLGELNEALAYHERYLEIAVEDGDKDGEERARHNLGVIYNSLGDFRKAISCYEFQLEHAKQVGDKDREKHTSCKLGNAYWKLDDYKKAIHYHERHLNMAKEMEDVAGEGEAYGGLGVAYSSLGDWKRARGFHESCLKIAKEVGDKVRESQAYHALGHAHFAQGDFRQAIDCHEKHLKLCEEDGNRAGESHACAELGKAHFRLGELNKSLAYYKRNLEIAVEDGDKDGEVCARGKLGGIYYSLGYFRKAIPCIEFQLEHAKQVGDIDGEKRACGNLGFAYRSLGDFKKAKDYHERQLNIAKEMGDVAGQGNAFCGLGNAYYSFGDRKKAMAFYERSLKIAKEVGDKLAEARAYANLANYYHDFGDFEKAKYYCELQLEISTQMRAKDLEGLGYRQFGNIYTSVGMFKKSIEYYEHSLKIAKEVGNKAEEAYAYVGLGHGYKSLGDFGKAIDNIERCLKITIEIGDVVGEGRTYANLGGANCMVGNLKNAIEYHGKNLNIVKQVGDRAEEGISYYNLSHSYLKLGKLEEAKEHLRLSLKISKEVGDRGLEAKTYYRLGQIYESEDSLHEASDSYQSSVAILNEIRKRSGKEEWKISLRDLHHDAYTALWGILLKQDKTMEALCAAEKGRAQALSDLMKSNYGLGSTDLNASTGEEITDGVFCGVPNNTIFTAFSIKNRCDICVTQCDCVINFWILQNGKDVCMRTKEVKVISQLDNAIKSFQMFMKGIFDEISLSAGVKCEDRSLKQLRKPFLAREKDERRLSDTPHFETHPLRTLHEVVIDPIADLVHGEELIFVPEGPLCLAPYAAFIDSNSKFLCESFRIRVIPSLTSLKLITDCPADYHRKTGALLVGDPWVQDVVNYQGERLQQLPCAREEVEMIGRILKTMPLTGSEATKDGVLSRLSSVALIHIAAHGRMETGEIALAPNPTRASPQPKEEDFLLTMTDVLNVRLRARLVVLSCCHSGRGEIKAEGVVGIARAFLGAGARSVLVSLWAIDDAATLEFMKCFYQDLAKGRSASEALDQAMKSMRESQDFSEVKYWAPFVLIGDDVTLEFDGSD